MNDVKLHCECGDLLGHFVLATGSVLVLARNPLVRSKAAKLAVASIRLGYGNALADAVIARGNEPLADSELADSFASPTDRQILAAYFQAPAFDLNEHRYLLLACTCRLAEGSAHIANTLLCVATEQLKTLWATAYQNGSHVAVAKLDRFDPLPMIEALRYGCTAPVDLDPWDQWIADSHGAKRSLYKLKADEWSDDKLEAMHRRYRQEVESLPVDSKERADKLALVDELGWRLQCRSLDRAKRFLEMLKVDDWPTAELGRFQRRYRKEVDRLQVDSRERADKSALVDELGWHLESRALERANEGESTSLAQECHRTALWCR